MNSNKKCIKLKTYFRKKTIQRHEIQQLDRKRLKDRGKQDSRKTTQESDEIEETDPGGDPIQGDDRGRGRGTKEKADKDGEDHA